MKRLSLIWLAFAVFLFWELIFKGFVAVPADTLVGAYLPWREYKWGYVVGVPVKNALISDVFSQFFIWKHLEADIIRTGQLPLLNQFSFSGNPLLATFHSNVLFPSSLLVYLLPRFTGWNLYIALSTVVAGLSMALYLFRVLKNRPAAIVGSVIFALAGPMTAWAEFGTAVWGMSLIPLVFFLIEKIKASPKPLYYAALSVLTSAITLSGNVQVLTYYCGLFGAYVIFTFWSEKQLLKRGLGFAAVFILGLGLSAIQLFPTAQMYRTSIRAGEQFAATINFGLSDWSQIIRLWSADFYGNPVTHNNRGAFEYHEYTSFLGSLAVCLILAFLPRAKKYAHSRFSAIVFLISIILAYANPLSKFLFNLPLPLFTYSSASRIFFVLAFSGGILAAFSLRELISDSRFRWRVLISATILATVSVIFLLFTPKEFQWVSARNLAVPLGSLFLLFALCLLNFRRTAIAVFIIFALMFDLGRYYRKYNPFVPARIVFPATLTTDFLRRDSGFRIINESDEAFPPNTWAYYKISSAEGYDPLYSLAYNRLINVTNLQRYFSSPWRVLDITTANPKFLDILSVKYLVGQPPEKSIHPLVKVLLKSGWVPAFTEGGAVVYQNPTVFPRAFFVTDTRTAVTEADIASVLEDPAFDPRTTAVIPQALSFPASPSRPVVDTVNVSSSQISVTTHGDSPGLLVLSQSYDPGWKVTIDQVSVPILRADGGLMAIPVNSGPHVITARYLPDSLVSGSFLTLLSLLLVVILATRAKIAV